MKLPTIPLFNLTRFSCLIKILMNQSTAVCFNCGMIILMIMVLLRVIDLIAPYLQMHLFFLSLKSHFSRQLSMFLFFCSYLGGLNKVHIINSPMSTQKRREMYCMSQCQTKEMDILDVLVYIFFPYSVALSHY